MRAVLSVFVLLVAVASAATTMNKNVWYDTTAGVSGTAQTFTYTALQTDIDLGYTLQFQIRVIGTNGTWSGVLSSAVASGSLASNPISSGNWYGSDVWFFSTSTWPSWTCVTRVKDSTDNYYYCSVSVPSVLMVDQPGTVFTFAVSPGTGATGNFASVRVSTTGMLVPDASVPVDVDGPAYTETIPCCGFVASSMKLAMSSHDHKYILARVTQVASTYGLYGSYMRNLEFFSFNDRAYFSGNSFVTVRTCVTNTSCAVQNQAYYTDTYTLGGLSSANAVASTSITASRYTAVFRLQAASSHVSASAITLAAAAIIAVVATKYF